MRDPIPPPPSFLFNLSKPLAEFTGLYSLPYHIHEVLFGLFLYQSIQSVISPVLSNFLFPNIYPKLTPRTRINWDVHVVSLVQSLIINTLALWVMFTDKERYDMKNNTAERIYGYTGASGLLAGLAMGYFIWDLIVSTRFIKIFGVGIWAHAVTALFIFSFGFRPFCNYYGPVFLLYELSSPFLNVHWFCDKLNLTGSKLQWYNGMLLLGSFFGCRLVWGTYQSFRVYRDVYNILQLGPSAAWVQGGGIASTAAQVFKVRDGQLCLGDVACIADQMEVMGQINSHNVIIPLWLAVIHLSSNLILNALNFYWFGKMIETVRKRFAGKPHDEFKRERERQRSVIEEAATRLDREVLTGPETPAIEKSEIKLTSASLATGAQVDGAAIRKR